MRERTPLQDEAHASAKAWFKSRNVPHWTSEYQTQYPIYVSSYIRAWKREEKKRAKLQA